MCQSQREPLGAWVLKHAKLLFQERILGGHVGPPYEDWLSMLKRPTTPLAFVRGIDPGGIADLRPGGAGTDTRSRLHDE